MQVDMQRKYVLAHFHSSAAIKQYTINCTHDHISDRVPTFDQISTDDSQDSLNHRRTGQ